MQLRKRVKSGIRAFDEMKKAESKDSAFTNIGGGWMRSEFLIDQNCLENVYFQLNLGKFPNGDLMNYGKEQPLFESFDVDENMKFCGSIFCKTLNSSFLLS